MHTYCIWERTACLLQTCHLGHLSEGSLVNCCCRKLWFIHTMTLMTISFKNCIRVGWLLIRKRLRGLACGNHQNIMVPISCCKGRLYGALTWQPLPDTRHQRSPWAALEDTWGQPPPGALPWPPSLLSLKESSTVFQNTLIWTNQGGGSVVA